MDLEVLNDYEQTQIGERQPLPERYLGVSEVELDARITVARAMLGDRLVILGHHYQRDEVFKFADYTGDSLQLAKAAAGRSRAEFIVFCGVHFMAGERGRPERAAPEGRPAGPGRRLLDGRHGGAGRP